MLKSLKPMGTAWAPMSATWTPMRPGTSASLGSDIGVTACHRRHCSVTSVPGSLCLCSASWLLCDLSDAAFMTYSEAKTTSKVPSPGADKAAAFALTGGPIPGDRNAPKPMRRSDVDGDPKSPKSSVHTDVLTTSGSTRVDDGPSSSSSGGDVPMLPPPDPTSRAKGPMSLILDIPQTSSGTVVPKLSRSVPVVVTVASTSDDDTRRLTGLGDPSVTDVFPGNRAPTWIEGIGVGVDGLETFHEASNDKSDDENTFDEVEHPKKTKKAKKKARAKVCPDPPGSSLSDEKSLRHLRKICRISEEIVLVAPTPADRADAPPAGYMTLFQNFFDQCLLWFPLPRFLMRFLAVNGVCLAQFNPRGIRHLLGIYVLSRERGVDISTENLSYLTDFRTRGLSEELKHSVTNSSGMALIAGFPMKPAMPKVSKDFLAAMHKELSSGNGNWRRSFNRKRIERALSTEILPGKILGQGLARLSLREQIALEAAAKTRGSSVVGAPRVVMLMTLTPPAPSTRARTSQPFAPKTVLPPPSSGDVAEFRRLSAERARVSSGKGKGVDRVTPSKRQRTDAFPAAAFGGEASASCDNGLLRGEAYSIVKSRYSELFLLFDRLVGDYDEDVRSRGSELSASKEANAALQSRLDETVERNEALGRDALALHWVKKDYEDKLSKLKSRCAKAEGETIRLRGELSSASDLQRSRIDTAVAEARDKMTRGFVERTSEVAGLLAEIGGKAQNDMLNLTEIDVNLEFIGLLQGSEPPDLSTEVKSLHGRRHPIYDAHDVFADLLASVRRVLEIPTAPAGAVDDDVESSDEDVVEVTGDEGADD
ncbi:hypothetical protein AALP_AA7G136500 [Arabis alpina]|uniref:DUF1204 domain-containing protein n=1 Tax=Arabis alpina TaxID=50452 RepID=A0A087GHV2_ARAAL|nr:hypothetical protein AALP_AA7G136500 [Arabis alpina]